MSDYYDPEVEKQFYVELKRELSPAERDFLRIEKDRSFLHHEKMKELIAGMPELRTRPVLFINATDKGMTGSDFFKELDPALLDFFVQIQTGQRYDPQSNFNYRAFPDLVFRHMFGFDTTTKQFQTVRTLDDDAKIPESTKGYSLVIGSGGEINHLNTQKEYQGQLRKIQALLKQVLLDGTPFVMTCATHQIMGQVAHEMTGNTDLIIDEFKDKIGRLVTESGVIELFRYEQYGQAEASPFTNSLPDRFSVMSNHGQYLTQIPEGAISLAGNQFNGIPINTQILGYKNGVGIQAHPECSPASTLVRNRMDRAAAILKGQTLPKISEPDPRPTWIAREVLFPNILQFIHNRRYRRLLL